MAVAFQNLLVEETLPTVVVTLNRPEKLNALSVGLMEELTAELAELGKRDDAAVIVLRGAGRAFSAGHDLQELVDRTVEEERETFATCERLMATVQSIPQPVIASVHGIATAAGCQLVASCDLAIASTDARFATNGIRNGIFCYTPMVPVSRAIGRKRALEMVLTGNFIDAATAERWGLVNRVVAAGELDAAVLELAAQIGSLSPLAVRSGKAAFYQQVELSQGEAYGLMTEAIACNATSEDAQEGMSAFLQKRKPTWKGR
ncbi:MAG TPA: enoyl-CoA hydratase [Candidatus Dormibacteraeota bacterium]|nr:enoyl-CoA hydratase [Candidatus Dormibacteraeota bacterium]